jgi:hypothetical protein
MVLDDVTILIQRIDWFLKYRHFLEGATLAKSAYLIKSSIVPDTLKES